MNVSFRFWVLSFEGKSVRDLSFGFSVKTKI